MENLSNIKRKTMFDIIFKYMTIITVEIVLTILKKLCRCRNMKRRIKRKSEEQQRIEHRSYCVSGSKILLFGLSQLLTYNLAREND